MSDHMLPAEQFVYLMANVVVGGHVTELTHYTSTYELHTKLLTTNKDTQSFLHNFCIIVNVHANELHQVLSSCCIYTNIKPKDN